MNFLLCSSNNEFLNSVFFIFKIGWKIHKTWMKVKYWSIRWKGRQADRQAIMSEKRDVSRFLREWIFQNFIYTKMAKGVRWKTFKEKFEKQDQKFYWRGRNTKEAEYFVFFENWKPFCLLLQTVSNFSIFKKN